MLTGAEALLRWTHSEQGMISPEHFIPIAEQSGFIIDIGDWVLHHACEQIIQWQQSGLEAVPIAVNISSLQLRRSDFTDKLQRILRTTGLQPHYLELELTESTILHATRDVLIALQSLRAAGVQIALDDFGTGYSSLGSLRSLPIDKLKIDRGFVRDLEDDNDDAVIVEAIIALGHRLKLKIVAEGVETQKQLDFLRMEGCDFIQGYLISQPLPAQVFIEFLRASPDKTRRHAALTS
jgi:EAL domain-containing protein (putative c-di-GMP-specific phosphodiesterase class I)